MMKNLSHYIFENDLDNEIFYHGSNASFSKFNLEYVNTGNKMQAFGYGIYVTSSKEAAEKYGKNIYKVKIPNIKSKYIEGNKIYNKNFVLKIFKKLYIYILKNNFEEYKGVEKEFWNELESIVDNYDGNQIYGTISSYLGSDKDASSFLNEMGYIGVIFKDKNIINAVIFDADNINILN